MAGAILVLFFSRKDFGSIIAIFANVFWVNVGHYLLLFSSITKTP